MVETTQHAALRRGKAFRLSRLWRGPRAALYERRVPQRDSSRFSAALKLDPRLPLPVSTLVYGGGALSILVVIHIDAEDGAGLIQALGTANDWVIDGPDSGLLGMNIPFSGIEDLPGGNADDNFLIGPGASLCGVSDGSPDDARTLKPAVDRLDYSVFSMVRPMASGLPAAQLTSVYVAPSVLPTRLLQSQHKGIGNR